jgi:hypothetical protein
VHLVEYSPDDFDLLRGMAQALRVPSLAHRPFVNHYYTDNSWAKLYLLRAREDTLAGTIGVERMPFDAGGQRLTLGMATNFYAPQPGAGGLLYLHWLKTCGRGLVFGGSEDTHRILRRQRWTYFPGVKTLALNRRPHLRPGEPWWRRAAKRIVARARRTPLRELARRGSRAVLAGVSVREEPAFTQELLPRTSPFSFRLAPSLEYLRWRYDSGLSFVRYRLFRILYQGSTSGYVVLNDRPEKVLVAHGDATDAAVLACGVLLSLAALGGRSEHCPEVLLACSHPEMLKVYRSAGFRDSGEARPFVIGSHRGRVELPADPPGWSVHYDWGDNGLRAPFLDQAATQERENTNQPVGAHEGWSG